MAKFDEQKLIFINKKEISTHTVEDVHSLKLNYWRGWYCSAGIRSLYIHHDGLIYRGTCAVGGALGSIYNSGLGGGEKETGWLYNWVMCDRETCACGTDMQSPKVKNLADTKLISIDGGFKEVDYNNFAVVDQVQDPNMIFCGAFKHYKLVIWELGRRCNYDCSYCFPDSHNNYESYKTLGSLMQGLKNLSEGWAVDQKMKFVFTGGEPTFNPDFLEFVTHLHDDLQHISHTTTNGSQTPEYYAKLMQVSDIGFSAHLSYLENPKIYAKFVKNVASAADSKKTNDLSDLNWLGVRIMLQPGKLELAKQLYHDCKGITTNVVVDLIHGRDKQIIPYSQDEIDWVAESNQQAQ